MITCLYLVDNVVRYSSTHIVTSSFCGRKSLSVRLVPSVIIKCSERIKRWVGLVTFCLTPQEFSKSVNTTPNASFVLSRTRCMLKSQTISTLSTLKSANSFRKSTHRALGVYTVASVFNSFRQNSIELNLVCYWPLHENNHQLICIG